MKRILLIFMVVVLATTCFAQRSDWRKTKRMDTYAAYQTFLKDFPNSEYHSIAQDSLFQKLKERNQINAYEDFIINNPSSKYYDIALDSVFSIVSRENSIAAFESFLKKYPSSNYYDIALDSVFSIVSRVNSIVAFEGFIKKHPSSKHHNVAVDKIFQIVSKENSVQAYENFIKKYPGTEFATSAIEGIFNIVSINKSIDGLESFISKYPNFSDISLAKQLLEEANYYSALERNSIVTYEHFLIKYPNSKYYSEIRKALISNSFQQVKNSTNAYLIGRFISNFPDAQTYGIPISHLDSIFWASCVSSDISIEFSNYRNYLKSFPDGVFRKTATERIYKMVENEWSKSKKENTYAAYDGYRQSFPNSKYSFEADKIINKYEAKYSQVSDRRYKILMDIRGITSMSGMLNITQTRPTMPFLDAIYIGDVNEVKAFIKRGGRNLVNLTFQEVEGAPLMLASFLGHFSIVELLVKSGAKVSIKTRDLNPVIVAAAGNHSKVVEFLLENGGRRSECYGCPAAVELSKGNWTARGYGPPIGF